MWAVAAGLAYGLTVGLTSGLALGLIVGLTVRIDGSGGYQVVETDSPADLAETTAKFAPFADFQIEPVLDVADAVGAA